MCQAEQEQQSGFISEIKVNVQITGNSIVHVRYGRQSDSGTEAYDI